MSFATIKGDKERKRTQIQYKGYINDIPHTPQNEKRQSKLKKQRHVTHTERKTLKKFTSFLDAG